MKIRFFYISKFMAGNNQTKVVLIGTDSWDRADWNGQLGRDERGRGTGLLEVSLS
jgi:hypothetical protein